MVEPLLQDGDFHGRFNLEGHHDVVLPKPFFGEHVLLIYLGIFPISLGPALVLLRKNQAVPVEAAVVTE